MMVGSRVKLEHDSKANDDGSANGVSNWNQGAGKATVLLGELKE